MPRSRVSLRLYRSPSTLDYERLTSERAVERMQAVDARARQDGLRSLDPEQDPMIPLGMEVSSRGQVTTLGKLLDPIADKLLISAAFISLVELERVPAWIVVVIVGREFAVSGLRYIALADGLAISASYLGKGKMAAQVFAVALLLVEPYGEIYEMLAYPALAVAVVLTIVSMLDYFRGFWGVADPTATRTDADLVVLPERGKKRDVSNR